MAEIWTSLVQSLSRFAAVERLRAWLTHEHSPWFYCAKEWVVLKKGVMSGVSVSHEWHDAQCLGCRMTNCRPSPPTKNERCLGCHFHWLNFFTNHHLDSNSIYHHVSTSGFPSVVGRKAILVQERRVCLHDAFAIARGAQNGLWHVSKVCRRRTGTQCRRMG